MSINMDVPYKGNYLGMGYHPLHNGSVSGPFDPDEVDDTQANVVIDLEGKVESRDIMIDSVSKFQEAEDYVASGTFSGFGGAVSASGQLLKHTTVNSESLILTVSAHKHDYTK